MDAGLLCRKGFTCFFHLSLLNVTGSFSSPIRYPPSALGSRPGFGKSCQSNRKWRQRWFLAFARQDQNQHRWKRSHWQFPAKTSSNVFDFRSIIFLFPNITLRMLKIYKSTGNLEAARVMYAKYSEVSSTGPYPFAEWRSLILEKKQPRKIFVQSNTCLEGRGKKIPSIKKMLKIYFFCVSTLQEKLFGYWNTVQMFPEWSSPGMNVSTLVPLFTKHSKSCGIKMNHSFLNFTFCLLFLYEFTMQWYWTTPVTLEW